MAHTVKDKFGGSSTPTPTGTAGEAYLIGPPSENGPYPRQGRYILQSISGANTVYRWIADERCLGDAPTTYRFTGAQ